MDGLNADPRANASLVDTIHIDRLARPLWIVTISNCSIIIEALNDIFGVAFFAFLGHFNYLNGLVALWLVFPGWIAWKNANVLQSLNQRYTIPSLLFVGLPAFLLGMVGLLWNLGLWNFDIDLAPEKTNRLEFRHINIFALGSIALFAALMVWRLRHRMVDPLGIELASLLSAISSQRTSARPRNVKQRRPVLGWMLLLAATAMMMFHTLLVYYGDLAVPLPLPGSSVLFGFGFVLILFARSAFQPSATALLKQDARKPVLLLRSFVDDEKTGWQVINGQAGGSRGMSSFIDPSLESRLTSHFAFYGPFIAVGAPSETMPIIGAARARLTDAEWQDQVVHWIKDSIVVLMIAGVTTWVEWELKQVLAHDALNKLIIYFPPLGHKLKQQRNFAMDMETRLNRLRHSFAATPWTAALEQLNDAKSLRSLVLRQDGRVAVVRAMTTTRDAYHLAVLIGHWVMNIDGLAEAGIGAAPQAVEVTPTPKIEQAESGIVLSEVAIPVGTQRDRRRLRLYPIGRNDVGPWDLLFEQTLTVGRSPQNQICIHNDSQVSADHCILSPNGRLILVQDLNSRNGTRVNGVPINGFLHAEAESVLGVGRTELRMTLLPENQ